MKIIDLIKEGKVDINLKAFKQHQLGYWISPKGEVYELDDKTWHLDFLHDNMSDLIKEYPEFEKYKDKDIGKMAYEDYDTIMNEMFQRGWTKMRLFDNGYLNIYFKNYDGLRQMEDLIYKKGLLDKVVKVVLENENGVRKNFEKGEIFEYSNWEEAFKKHHKDFAMAKLSEEDKKVLAKSLLKMGLTEDEVVKAFNVSDERAESIIFALTPQEVREIIEQEYMMDNKYLRDTEELDIKEEEEDDE